MADNGDSTPSNVTPARQIQRKRKQPPTSSRLANGSNKSARTNTPNAYARRTPPPEPANISDESDTGRRPTQLKRPGAGARIAREQRDAADRQRKEREEDERRRVGERQGTNADAVAEHYNLIPERGRDWRKTDSTIKGLRSLNNWVKSTLIQKFSKPDVVAPHGVLVLDMACGKGGDLGKWEKAPIVPALYVGCDIADISIEQARQRYEESRRRGGRGRRGPPMDAQFYVQDTFGRPLNNIRTIEQVGFNSSAGPGGGPIGMGGMEGGFDVVSMMFALHYSFESETLARGMLKNVAGSLKKGGKFIGVMPNSDVISATVKKLLREEAPGQTPAAGKTPHANGSASEKKDDGEDEDEWDPEKPAEPVAAANSAAGDAEEDDWDPEKPSEPAPPAANGTMNGAVDEEDDWDPEKSSEAPQITSQPAQSQQNGTTPAQQTPAADLTAESEKCQLEWGNSIYKVSFPRVQKPSSAQQSPTQKVLPKDGVFRPPYGWKYFYHLDEAVNAPEYVVPWEGFRALAEDYGLELLYRKGFREVFEDESTDRELGMLAERMGVMSRDRAEGRNGLLVSDEEMEAASFYHAFCFYRT